MMVIMLVPGIAWYWHAHELWLAYGNSMGLSNETHWAGLDAITHPQLTINVLVLNIRHIWRVGGVMAVFGALVFRRHPGTWFASLWLSAKSRA